MKPFVVKGISLPRGEITLSGDKSIAHRSVIISALSPGRTRIENFPANKDCLSTITALKNLGVKITKKHSGNNRLEINVTGNGLLGFKKPKSAIFVGDSGTTFRLLLGLLAGQDFKAKVSAGPSLSKRPMLRVTEPLRMMGATIKAKGKRQKAKLEEYPPITIKGGNLKPINYKLPVASAQVKSAILLAALFAKGETRIIEPIPTRDHTERMLKLFKADIKTLRNTIVIKGNRELVPPKKIYVPGDISSAGFFIVLAAVAQGSKICLKNISLNPSRLGIIRVLKRMGADIKLKAQSSKLKTKEPMGDILVKNSPLKGTIVKENEIPSLIDELPVLMVAACMASGQTVFEGVQELRVKETDRIRSMTGNLKKMGAEIQLLKTAASEKILIKGTGCLRGAKVKSFGDHRSAMSMIVAGSQATGTTLIDDISCIDKSFPGFLNALRGISQN